MGDRHTSLGLAGGVFIGVAALIGGCPGSGGDAAVEDAGTSSEASASGGSSGDGATSSGDGSSGSSSGDGSPGDSAASDGATCTDGDKNGAETDVDCGGPTCPKCATKRACVGNGDCSTGVCSKSVCVEASCTDLLKSVGETDVDCGGASCAPCADGKLCVTGADCESKSCDVGGTCLPPTSADGIQNGTETDVDCGGAAPTNAPACGKGKGCLLGADCLSTGCNTAKKCASAPSCTQVNGAYTCGAAADADCCETTFVNHPTSPFYLDKYIVTAGRVREFVTRVGGDVRGYIAANRPPGFNPGWDAYLPVRMGAVGDLAAPNTVYGQLGPGVVAAQALQTGCATAQFGARAFRAPDAVNTAFGDPQDYSQAESDQRMMQCWSWLMAYAFCAWDGGRLPTQAEGDFAWDSGDPANYTYPWGNAPAPAGFSTTYASKALAGTSYNVAVPPADPARANYRFNFWLPATRVGTDTTIYLAPPGSFPTGAGPFGHQDLAGGIFTFTSTIVGASTSNPTSLQVRWSRSGTFDDGHAIPSPAFNFSATTKYYALGARCARDSAQP